MKRTSGQTRLTATRRKTGDARGLRWEEDRLRKRACGNFEVYLMNADGSGQTGSPKRGCDKRRAGLATPMTRFRITTATEVMVRGRQNRTNRLREHF